MPIQQTKWKLESCNEQNYITRFSVKGNMQVEGFHYSI